jgi:hypothetical protein
MRITILRDSTVTVTAGQTVDVRDVEAARLLSMGWAAIPEEKKPEKKSKKKAK